MPPINVITAAFVILGFALVLRAYIPIISRHLGNFSFYVMRGVAIGLAVGIARSGYWDFAQFLLGDTWPGVRDAFGGQKISSVFNLILLFACCDFLKARLALIPENERWQYRWWNAWTHPKERCVLNWWQKK